MDLDNLEKEIKEIRIKLCNEIQNNAGRSDEEQNLKMENINLINDICFSSLRMIKNQRSKLLGEE